MVEPNKYKVNKLASERSFKKHNFIITSEKMYIRKTLYNEIQLTIYIDKEDYFVRYQVMDTNNSRPYHPFYNPDLRHDNLVYIEVANNFNAFMDELVGYKLFKKVNPGKKKQKQEKKSLGKERCSGITG